MDKKKPFIPRNKPKSWVIGVLSCLIGLGFGLLTLTAGWLEIILLSKLGYILFLINMFICFPAMLIFNIKNFSGQYLNLSSKDWKDQDW